jgi:hypothetical protein
MEMNKFGKSNEFRIKIIRNKIFRHKPVIIIQDWIGVSGDAYYPPGTMHVLWDDGEVWRAENSFVIEKNVRALDLNN